MGVVLRRAFYKGAYATVDSCAEAVDWAWWKGMVSVSYLWLDIMVYRCTIAVGTQLYQLKTKGCCLVLNGNAGRRTQ